MQKKCSDVFGVILKNFCIFPAIEIRVYLVQIAYTEPEIWFPKVICH